MEEGMSIGSEGVAELGAEDLSLGSCSSRNIQASDGVMLRVLCSNKD